MAMLVPGPTSLATRSTFSRSAATATRRAVGTWPDSSRRSKIRPQLPKRRFELAIDAQCARSRQGEELATAMSKHRVGS